MGGRHGTQILHWHRKERRSHLNIIQVHHHHWEHEAICYSLKPYKVRCLQYNSSQIVHSTPHRFSHSQNIPLTELIVLRNTTEYLEDNEVGVIFRESKLQVTNAITLPKIVTDIKRNLFHGNDKMKDIQFVWNPSHVGINEHEIAGQFAPEASDHW